MDYTYIEHLLERYWEAETSPAEEAILKNFFTLPELPAQFAPYRPLFAAQAAMSEVTLDASFDERVMAAIKATDDAPRIKTKARRITWVKQLSPLYKAAAVVAIVLTLGNAVQYSWQTAESDEATLLDYQYSDYKDTYSDDKSAYEVASKALNTLSIGARTHQADTSRQATALSPNATAR